MRTAFYSALLLGLAVVAACAAESTSAAVSDHAEERQIIEKDLARLYALIQQDDDPASKTTFRGYHQEYVRRATLLMQNFDPKKYDDLRYDINVHCQRLAKRQAPLAILPRTQQWEAEHEVAIARFDPSPDDPAEVKAALAAADDAIKREEQRLGKLSSADRLREGARIQRLKELRAVLAKQFTKPGWDAFVSEVKPTTR